MTIKINSEMTQIRKMRVLALIMPLQSFSVFSDIINFSDIIIVL